MKRLLKVVALPLAALAAFFAVANREPVAIDLWPFAGQITLPLFLALIFAAYAGFLVGAMVAWGAMGRTRARARDERRRADALEREARDARARFHDLTPALDAPPADGSRLPVGR